MEMGFWGVELKGDKPVMVAPGLSYVIHLSGAVLTEMKKKSEPVMLYAKVGCQKLVIGILKADSIPQLTFDLVFEQEVELSHNGKDGCVHLTGYKSLIPEEDDEVYADSDDDKEEALALPDKPNGVVAAAASKAKPTVAPVTDKKITEESDSDDESDDDDDDEDDSEDESGEGDESDEEMDDADSSDEEEEEEETPVKSVEVKKRPASALKTPEAKKAKAGTPQKTDGKKTETHVATPHPAKNAKTPKSGGAQTSCGSCKKTFNSQGALDSHTKAKHSNGK